MIKLIRLYGLGIKSKNMVNAMDGNHNLHINMSQLLVNLSTSLDFSIRGITAHHQRVAVISLNLAKAAGMGPQELITVFQSSIIHDIGAINWKEKSNLLNFEISAPHAHCINGAQLLANAKTLAGIDTIILSHHDYWQGRNNASGLKGSNIPLISRIIHLADRLDVLIRPEQHILEQRTAILSQLQAEAGTIFDPALVDLLMDVSRQESFWLDVVSPWLHENLTSSALWQGVEVEMEGLFDLAHLFARVIDHKSPFTHRHSRAVSMVSALMASNAGLSENETRFITIAGLLHDIGKLSVPDSILEKPGKLLPSEMHWIKQHTYYTYKILQPLAPSTFIPQWAAYHHEKLNGQGYPFGHSAEQLDVPARIVAISDIFTALREDRPYRLGLNWGTIMDLLKKEAAEGSLDPHLCALLFDLRKEIDDRWQAISS